MDRTEKQAASEALAKDLAAPAAVFAFDYRGLKVEEVTELRRKIRESGGRYRVVKNTIAKRALEGDLLFALESHLKGMTGIAFTDEDPVALAKVLSDFAKEVPALEFKAGVMAEKELDRAAFAELASLPGKEELQAKFLSVLQATIQNFLGVLQAPARDLVLVLKAASEKPEAS